MTLGGFPKFTKREIRSGWRRRLLECPFGLEKTEGGDPPASCQS
jgi:hypothetical protein